MKTILLFMAVCICTSSFSQTDTPVATTSEAGQQTAMLYVYRPKNMTGSIISYNLHVDDSVVCRVKNNSKFAIALPKSGQVEIWAKNEQKISFKINIKPGRNYYIKCGIKMGVFSGRPDMNLVVEEVGEIEYEAVQGRKNKEETDTASN